MFSFQHSDDHLVFHQIPSLISFQQQARINQQDLVLKLHDHVPMEGTSNTPATKARKLLGDHSPSSKPNISATTDQGVVDQDSKDEHTQRKLAHREIERQRRRDMAELYASLRGLLPLEFVKGKRSTSDHMHQTVNYIKHMQENIKFLSVKRDQLKKFVEAAGVPGPAIIDHKNTEKEKLMNLLPNTVSVISCIGGVQISVNSCLIEDGFPLSRVLKAISDQGQSVISCSCTKVNHRLIHSIQTEVNDAAVSTDISMMQQRLSAVANNY